MDVAAKEEKTREGEAEAADKPTTRTAIARQRFAYNYNLLFEMRVECLPHRSLSVKHHSVRPCKTVGCLPGLILVRTALVLHGAVPCDSQPPAGYTTLRRCSYVVRSCRNFAYIYNKGSHIRIMSSSCAYYMHVV